MQNVFAKSVLRLTCALLSACLLWATAIRAEEQAPPKPATITYKTESNIYYPATPEDKADDYQKTQCRLDVYVPENNPGFATIVWFHGGGLTGGKKYIPQLLKGKGFGVIGAEYRLSPGVKCPVYLQDAAEAVAWVFKNIERYGGDPKKIFISGHSAGGYLTGMLGLDPQWLGAHNIQLTDLAGFAPMSGMMTTHFHIREERGDKEKRVIIDEFSPIWHIRKDAAPMLLVTGDREMDWPGRVEENLLLARMMKVVRHNNTTMYELQGYGHGMEAGGMPVLVQWVEKQLKKQEAAQQEQKKDATP